MGAFEQIYNPVGNIWLSAIVAAIPIMFFIVALTMFKMRAFIAGVFAALLALVLAVLVYGLPLIKGIWSAIFGVLAGIWPVAAIVVFAILLYKLTVKTGQFEIIKDSITDVTSDKRLQVLLIAYCFGAFLEGVAGFGAPVAITSIMLIGLGFNPVKAAAICLVANIAGGAYGAMGIPVTVPAELTGVDSLDVAIKTAMIVPVISFIIPFILVFLADGVRGVRQTLVPTAICAGAFAVTQFVILITLGAVLVDIISAIVAMLSLAFYSKPKFRKSLKVIGKAWAPYYILTALVIIFSRIEFGVIKVPIPTLHNGIVRSPPVVSEASPYAAIFKFDVLTSTATAILIAGLLTIWLFRVDGQTVKAAFQETIKELKAPILTICAVLAFAYISNYSGMSSTLGIAFASTNTLFPLFSPVLGWLGVFLTGSVVNSGSLFAPLQVVTAGQIGIDATALVAANVIGGDIAKMISPQSVAVAVAAVGLTGKEGQIFKSTIGISIAFLVIVCVVNYIVYGVLG
ncbi:lactate permease LctP family transporter [Paenibacillus sp. BIC5C1]|uniref:L-lactate permease n=1 Tax=Paenibacillus sp. BIC5C1 TaxID=3078263 RepID=UPI0028EAD02C|nr:lactate permease LctP family transporter [Paenibacillus sp. BIC5C1]